MQYLVERVQKIGNERASGRRMTKCVLEPEFVQVSDESIGRGIAEGKRITPEIPLEGDDSARSHTCPNQGQSGLSASEARVEKT